MKPKDMSHSMNLILVSNKFIELKKMQLNGDKQKLEAKKNELTNILEKQWWGRSELLKEKAYIEKLLQEPITEALHIIKNADFYVASKTLYNIKDTLQESELKAAQTILESRLVNITEQGITEQNIDKNQDNSSQISTVQEQNQNIKIEISSEQAPQGMYSKLIDLGSRLLSIFNYNDSEFDNDDNSEGMICCSYVPIELVNPVAEILGETIGLATFNTKNQAIDGFDPVTNTPLPRQETSTSKATPERIYYESRRKELLDLKEKFETIQTGLKDACRYTNNNLLGLGHNYLKSITQSDIKSIIQPTIDAESKLNEEQKQQLREIRQADLHSIEQTIIKTQHNIVFLFKELIEQKNQAVQDFYDIVSDVNAHVNNYNNSLESNDKLNVDLHIVLANYEKHYQAEALLDEIKERIEELSFVMQYCKMHIKTDVLDKTTNISKVTEQETKKIKEAETLLLTPKKYWIQIKAILKNTYQSM